MRFLTFLLSLILAAVVGGAAGYVVARHETPAAASPGPGPGPATGGTATTVSLSERPMSWAQVAQQDGPSVVTIVNQQAPQQDIFGQMVPGSQDEGSGFVVNARGDIVTNNHVVAGEQKLTVVFSDGRKVPAQLIRADPYSDLAVIRVHTSNLPAPLQWGNSATLQPGDPVLAIGSALGEFRNSVTSGVVSALGRTIQESAQVSLHGMVQTDAAINQGNSGGPLLNDRGQVVGINTAVNRGSTTDSLFGASQSVVAEGLGFAIPSDTARNVAQRLMQNKPTAELGVQYVEVSQQLSTYYNLPIGAYIQSVVQGSSAARAGLQPRDIITKIDGQKVTDQSTLDQTIAGKAPGQTVTLTIWRNGSTFTKTVKLGAKS
jgi:2-alkenal reductase